MWESTDISPMAGNCTGGESFWECMDDRLLKIVDGGLAGVIFLLPWIMGGRGAIGQLVLAVLAVITTLAWTTRQAIRGGNVCRPFGTISLLLVGALFLLWQSAPLAPSWLEWLTPHQADLLPLWNDGAAGPDSLGCWSFVSFAPAETRAGLVLFLSYALLSAVTVQRVRQIEDIERILRWCALSALGMAAFGLVQLLAANGKFFWFYEYPFTTTLGCAKGSFTNANHFAHFLALGTGPLIWWLYDVSSRRKFITPIGSANVLDEPKNASHAPLLVLALALLLFAGILSFSRGGMAALGLATVVSMAFYYKSSRQNAPRPSRAEVRERPVSRPGRTSNLSSGVGPLFGMLALVGVMMISALLIFGFDQAAGEMESALDVTNKDTDWSGGRFALWKTTMKAVPDFLWTGTGVGSFSEVYPAYDEGVLPDRVEFTHAENSFVHNLLETGIFGLGMFLVGWSICVFCCAAGWKCGMRLKSIAGAIAAALAVCATQAMFDFVWHVPACAAMTVILAACAQRVHRLARKSPKPNGNFSEPRWVAFAAIAAVAVTGAWMIHNRLGPALAEPYWNRFLLARSAAKSSETKEDNVAVIETERKLLDCLEKAVYWDPHHARAHLALTEVHLRLFDTYQKSAPNRMTLMSIRDAALASQFSSQESLFQWLNRAVGDPVRHLSKALKHCRQSLALRPLQAEGYIYLAELGFLEGNRLPSKQHCVQQALRLRPYDGNIVYAAASEALFAGDLDQWLELLKRCFRQDRNHERLIIGNFIGRTPPEQIHETIDFICEHFQPDSAGLDFLYKACVKRCPPERLAGLNRTRARLAESEASRSQGTPAATLWLSARAIHASLGDGSRALDCARNAAQCDPDNYWARYLLAVSLMEQKMYPEAEAALEWCRKRKPEDKNLEHLAREVVKSRLNAKRDITASAKRF